MKPSSKRTGIRFDNDYGGNHIQRIKDSKSNTYLMLELDGKKQTCTSCHKRKPTKGGTRKNNTKFVCADCGSLEINIVSCGNNAELVTG